jgi:flagellar assembly protein FliH
MSDETWQSDALIAPQDRDALTFAPWFPQAPKAQAAPFNDWNLKRDAELERARLAAEAQAQADAEARAQAATAEAEVAEPELQSLNEAQLQQLHDEAYAQGLAQGREDLQAEWAQERAQQAALMQDMLTQWQGFRANTSAWLEPLKRLSLAVGEQLARAQLSLHPEQVNALIQACAEALGETRDHVMVHVNPEDLTRLKALDVRWPDEWHWVADGKLGVGSVRLSTDDSEVEDLMSHRLSVLAQQLLDPHLPSELRAEADAPASDEAVAPTAPPAAHESERSEAQAVLPRQAPPTMRERAAQADAVQDVAAVSATEATPPDPETEQDAP